MNQNLNSSSLFRLQLFYSPQSQFANLVDRIFEPELTLSWSFFSSPFLSVSFIKWEVFMHIDMLKVSTESWDHL